MLAVGVAEDNSAEAEAEGSNTAVVEDKHDMVVRGRTVVADVAEMAQDLVGVEEVAPVQT